MAPTPVIVWLVRTDRSTCQRAPRKNLQRTITTQLWNQHVQDHPRTTTRSYEPTHQRCSTTKPFKPQNGVTVIKYLPTATSEAQ